MWHCVVGYFVTFQEVNAFSCWEIQSDTESQSRRLDDTSAAFQISCDVSQLKD